MSVASASLVVAISLTVFAGANWFWLRADPEAPAGHLSALADWALLALALHALALIVTGTTSPGAYGLTVVLASAAAAVRRPPAGGVRHLSPSEGRFVMHPVEERADDRPHRAARHCGPTPNGWSARTEPTVAAAPLPLLPREMSVSTTRATRRPLQRPPTSPVSRTRPPRATLRSDGTNMITRRQRFTRLSGKRPSST